MKHHTFQHLLENAKFLNPKTHWTFSSEDFVGKMSILTASVSPGVSSTRLSLKVAPKHRILLHFLLTREGMQEAAMNIDWSLKKDTAASRSLRKDLSKIPNLEKGHLYSWSLRKGISKIQHLKFKKVACVQLDPFAYSAKTCCYTWAHGDLEVGITDFWVGFYWFFIDFFID